MKFNTYLFDFDGTLVDSIPTFVSYAVFMMDRPMKYIEDIKSVSDYYIYDFSELLDLE